MGTVYVVFYDSDHGESPVYEFKGAFASAEAAQAAVVRRYGEDRPGGLVGYSWREYSDSPRIWSLYKEYVSGKGDSFTLGTRWEVREVALGVLDDD